jgi:hypothetical protein
MKNTTAAQNKAFQAYRFAEQMAHHLTGWTAIQYAERHGGTLKKYRDPTERASKRVSIAKAKTVAREDPRLIYMDVKSGKHGL